MHRKWRYLTVQARWDKCRVPIYMASAKRKRIPLLKTLFSSYCINECKYCALRRGRKTIRAKWTVEELVNVTLNLWRKGKIKGIFLSSSIHKDPESTVQKQLEVVEELRKRGFKGYIHLRLMPGTPRQLIKYAVRMVDRIGINMEAPRKDIFTEVCPDKGDYWKDIMQRLKWCSEEVAKIKREKLCLGGVTTQTIVGLGESDLDHLISIQALVRKFNLKRMYFSAFTPIENTPLEKLGKCSKKREYRLYQAFFLIRNYNFTLEDLKTILDENEMLPNENLKIAYAKANPHLYPIDLSSASINEILKIPGIGPKSARKIIKLQLEGEAKWTIEKLVKIVGSKKAKRIAKYIVLS
ncbi:MAG: radical SAM protein [archaeon GB-1867-035]|nr:radical SAM protein [Candidatus Culexmicrobium profundum]